MRRAGACDRPHGDVAIREAATASRLLPQAMPTFKAFRERKEVGMCKGADPTQLEALVVAHQGDKWSAAGEGQVVGGADANDGMSDREKRLAALEKRGL